MGETSDCDPASAEELLLANYALSKKVLALITEITRLEAVYAMRVAEQAPSDGHRPKRKREAAGRHA